VQHLVLYPTSFVSLNPEELYPAPSIYLPSATKILVPRPSAVYAWILRSMLKYPRLCRVRTILASDLSELVDYHLYRVKEGYVTPEENPELWKELDMEGRMVDALKVIKQWTRNHEWREGEEWFGDALEAIVSEDGDIDYLPYSNSVS
jgi:DNA topoisomerase VI subunit B